MSRLAAMLRGAPGPAVARLYHRAFAAVAVVAWLSLARQVEILIGSRGLLPIGEHVARAAPTFWQFPTPFALWPPSDAVLSAGTWLGAGLSALALLGILPRILIGVSTFLYLGYAVACRDFLWFQWDNLLIECGALAVFLPRDRAATWIHVLFRLLAFKLYFESGVAKWQSHLHDWQDGSAMTYYYETAPLPTALAWTAHHLPIWWHHLESWATLVVELVVPFFFFGPRALRRAALVVLSGFQLVNLATANYGFFVLLALALHVFLLDDGDVERVRGWLRLRPLPALPAARGSRIVAAAVIALWVAISVYDAVTTFVDRDLRAPVLRQYYVPFRLVNTYHLFGHITRERIEPQFETSVDGETFVEHDMRYKPGDPGRAPPFVAPHQPRVDFLLWFYGLQRKYGTPEYVVRMLDRLCHDPAAVAPLFVGPLPADPAAVRITFFEYHFTRPGDPGWWTREPVGTLGPLGCR